MCLLEFRQHTPDDDNVLIEDSQVIGGANLEILVSI